MNLPSGKDSNVVWVVDSNHPNMDALTWVDELSVGQSFKVSQVSDILTVCQNKSLKNSTKIDFLVIFGHGTTGYQSIGAGKVFESTGRKSLRWKQISRPNESELFGTAEQAISGLNGILSNQATILLAGCDVGKGEVGAGLLRTVSTILNNRPVQGFECLTYWWTGHLIGPCKEAKGSNISSSFRNYSFDTIVDLWKPKMLFP